MLFMSYFLFYCTTNIKIIIDQKISFSIALPKMQKNKQNVINFFEDRYPTLLVSQPLPQYFRVTLPKQISAEEIIKLTSIHHPNIVNIKKILKIKNNNHNLKHDLQHPDYAIYYEAIRIGKPRGKSFSQALNRAIQFLICEGIFYKITAQNVGYDEQGNVKIYVPPSIVLGTRQTVHIKQVFEALNALIQSFEGMPNERLDRMKLIDEQLKNLKIKLNQGNVKLDQYRIKKNPYNRLNTEQNEYEHARKIPLKIQIPFKNRIYRDASADKIHQNFHCINIYQNKPNRLDKKLSQPKINNKFKQRQRSDSRDTYEKQMGEKPLMPKLNAKNFRETVQVQQPFDQDFTVPKQKKKKTLKRFCSINVNPSAGSLLSGDTKQTLFDNDESSITSIQAIEQNKFCNRNSFDVGFTIPWVKSPKKDNKQEQQMKKPSLQQGKQTKQLNKINNQTEKIENRVQQVLKKTKTALQLLKQNKFRKSYQKN